MRVFLSFTGGGQLLTWSAMHLVFTISLGLLFLCGCQSLPPVQHAQFEPVLTAPQDSQLRMLSNQMQQAESGSHFLLLNKADEALKWRLALIDSAVSSLDIQTFLWNDDVSGALVFDRVLEAATRGVRVRLLVDDIWLSSDPAGLAAIESHPYVAIRLYNPNKVRSNSFGQMVYFMMNFSKMNRRMHNKTFIADGVFAINGGRNIGDNYYGLSKKYNFRDLDVLSTGAVLGQVNHEFDRFWNSAMAYPASLLSNKADNFDLKRGLDKLRSEVSDHKEYKLQSYPDGSANWSARLNTLPQRMVSGTAEFIGDDPLGEDRAVVDSLTVGLAAAEREIIIVSPYFIPLSAAFSKIGEMTKQGVRVKIVVPSLGANNQTMAHSHYRKYRRAILDAGCELYEYNFQPNAQQRALCDVAPVTAPFIGMHMKAVLVDRETCFIGSLNMDPRAMDLNTEEGLIVHSPKLTEQLYQHISSMVEPANSWKLEYDSKGRIVWRGLETLTRQPARGMSQRIIDSLTRWLPIESQL